MIRILEEDQAHDNVQTVWIYYLADRICSTSYMGYYTNTHRTSENVR
jgi:hypothetical protein